MMDSDVMAKLGGGESEANELVRQSWRLSERWCVSHPTRLDQPACFDPVLGQRRQPARCPLVDVMASLFEITVKTLNFLNFDLSPLWMHAI